MRYNELERHAEKTKRTTAMSKKFPSTEHLIKDLRKRNKMTQKELLAELYDRLPNKPKKTRDEWVKTTESNFSSMKRGERDYTLDIKFAISEFCGTSWDKFLHPEPMADNVIPPHLGIYEAALYNDLRVLNEVYNKKSEDGDTPYSNSDELQNSVFDYVAEFQRQDGNPRLETIKFLIDKRVCPYGKAENIVDILISIIKSDDYELLDGFYRARRASIEHAFLYDRDKDTLDKIIPLILMSEKILDKLIAIREREDDKTRYIADVTYTLLSYAISEKNYAAMDKIFAVCENYVYAQIDEFIKEYGLLSQRDITCSLYNGIRIEYLHGDKFIELPRFDDDISEALEEIYKDRFSAISLDAVITLLCKKDFSDMKDGEIFEYKSESQVFHKTKKTLEYEMLENMTNAGVKSVPKYYGEKDGVQISEYISNHRRSRPDPVIIAAISAFNEIHRASEAVLGKDRVYLFKDASRGMQSIICTHDNRTVICGWIGNTEIGTPKKALTDAIIASLPHTEYALIYNRGEDAVNDIVHALASYYKPDALEEIGDAVCAELEERCCKFTNSKKKTDEYKTLLIKKVFADIYKDDFNKLFNGGV